MKRRDFLTNAALFGGTVPLAVERAAARASAPKKAGATWRGVNLGGWLALEKWITPTVYSGTRAEDEYTLCQVLGKAKASDRLKRHRETWITADDFQWLADHGINAVRLPIGYGVAEDNAPFITGAETLEWAFRTANAHGHRRLARPARRAGEPERLGPQRPPGYARLAYEQGEHRPFVAHRQRPGSAM